MMMVLSAPLAQQREITDMGTEIKFRALGDGSFTEPEFPAPDQVHVAHLAMLARPFTLEREQIFFGHLASALLRFAQTDIQRLLAEQLRTLWAQVPITRTQHYVALDGVELLPGGVTDAEVADRVLYSQLVHADDASEVLDHVQTPFQHWSLAGMVGDWVALVAHQQYVLKLVRPDLCTEFTAWAGSPRTIFERWGSDVHEVTEPPASTST